MSYKLQFTRYLYVKEEVKLSLILCILNKKDEAIFWAYELYYSGFKSDLIHLFWSMYYDFYYTLNPSFEKYLKQKLKTNLVFEINKNIIKNLKKNLLFNKCKFNLITK